MYKYLLSYPLASCCIKKQGGGIGDSLMLEYSVAFLRREFPRANIQVAYGTAHEAEYFSGLLLEETDFRKFSFVTDVTRVGVFYERPGAPVKNRIDIYREALGSPGVCSPGIRQSPVLCPDEFISLHLRSDDPKRSWAIENYYELIKKFSNETFVILDSLYSLDEIAFLISKSKLFIGPDSLHMHIAGLLGKRSIVLFGPSVPEARINYYKMAEALKDPDCGHCWHQECLRKLHCVNRIHVDTVSARLEKTLAEI